MKIKKVLYDTHASLELKGDFDDAELLLKAIDDLRAKGVTRISASLRMVKYLNSTALGTMVQARKLLQRESGDLVIVKPSPTSREIISTVGLDAVVPMFDDERAAARYLAGNRTAVGMAGAKKGAVEPSVVVFSFPDDRSELLGQTHRGVGEIASVDSKKIVFEWDPSRQNLDAEEVANAFTSGSPIRTKFQIKLVRKEFFEVAGTIEGFTNKDDGTVTVTANWSAISESDADALWQFAKDMAYLRRQVSGEAGSE